MTIPKIGEQTQDASLVGRRDAFHAPVILAKVNRGDVARGHRVVFVDPELSLIEYTDGEGHGVVDPFLPNMFYEAGQMVWVLLNPSTTSNLTHHFDISINPASSPIAVKYASSYVVEDVYDSCRGCYD